MVSGRKSSVSNLAPRKSSVALPSGLLKSYEVGDGPVERIDQIGKDTKATARAPPPARVMHDVATGAGVTCAEVYVCLHLAPRLSAQVKLAELRELLEELAVNGLPKGAGGEGEAGRGVDDAVAQRQIRELKQKLKEREVRDPPDRNRDVMRSPPTAPGANRRNEEHHGDGGDWCFEKGQGAQECAGAGGEGACAKRASAT